MSAWSSEFEVAILTTYPLLDTGADRPLQRTTFAQARDHSSYHGNHGEEERRDRKCLGR